jgi:dienelactone hydrolase
MTRVAALLVLALLAAPAAQALVLGEEIRVPVKVADIHGKTVEQEIVVGVFRETTAPAPMPLLVLNHGRAATPAGFARVRVRDYEDAARWLTRFGFLVAVPIRVGYGASGGPDIEFSGNCRARNYPPVYHAAAVQTLAVLAQLRQRPDAAKDRAVVAGQSFGGATAIAIASMNPEGVQATINFAGGGGGNPEQHPHKPCSEPRLRAMFAGYGKTARLPTLWLYSENDLYWGPALPREWFDAFKAAGGQGEFLGFPPVSDDGHRLFSRGPQLWQPRVREFLISIGYPPLN